MKLPDLVQLLTAGGLEPLVFKHFNGGSVVVLPHGARVIGLYTSPTADNAFWLDPHLDSPEKIKNLLTKEHVLGGDRLWVAPERGLSFVGTKESDGTKVPSQIDPGRYIIAAAGPHHVKLCNLAEAPYHLAPPAKVRVSVERTIRLCHSPFADAPQALPSLARVKFVGYEMATRFELLSAPTDNFYVGPWFLIQLPVAGYFYVPTTAKAVVTDYYEPTGPDYLRVEENHVRFRLDSINRHKIGIRKIEATGRMAYLRDEVKGEDCTLVVRNFFNNPSGHYADVPMHTPSGTQDSIQSYNHNTGPTGFGEMEHHAPGVKRAMPEPVISDTNQVWTFTGTRADLIPIAARLLGLPTSVFQ